MSPLQLSGTGIIRGNGIHLLSTILLRIEAGSAVLDIDKDGDPDIIFAGDYSSNEIWWWENPYPAIQIMRKTGRGTILKNQEKINITT